MKNVPTILKQFAVAAKALIGDLAKITPATATAIAGALAPVVAALLGMNITAAELAGELTVVGLVAGTLAKLPAVKAAASPAAPPAPPAPPAK